ncbi:MAG: 4-hydroxy-3-methylbut-2-enyl diphosphate reductase, partial [Candidatus Moranbacteria bacterium]|nr:4-hydroxy-3-methylbut-2-enyl diphosphate reductase [Candidatus Moranbacteria bacterium]
FDIVDNLEDARIKKPVFVLGSLVHNKDVVRRIEEKGIKKIDKEWFMQAKEGEIGTVIITAHGVGPQIYGLAKEKNIDVIDTTCPKVIKVQRLAQAYSKRGYAIILVGDKEHKEVKSIFEWGNGRATIVSDREDLKNIHLVQSEKIIILSQTTQSQDFVDEVYKFVKGKYPAAEIADTICLATNQRQGEVKKVARDNDAVIVIGSTESANSTRLYEIAKSLNKKSVFIESDEAMPECGFFKGVRKVAVTAGASTPDWIIERVVARLEGCKNSLNAV